MKSAENGDDSSLLHQKIFLISMGLLLPMKYVAIRIFKADDFVLSSRQSKEIMKISCKTEFFNFCDKTTERQDC